MKYLNKISQIKHEVYKPLLLILLFSFAYNILSLASPLYAMQVFDRVLNSGNMMTLLYLTVIAVALLTIMSGFSYLRTKIQYYIAENFTNSVKPLVLSRNFYENRQSNIMIDLTHIEKIKQFLAGPPLTSLTDIPFVPLFGITLYIIHPVLLGISVIGAIILFCISLIGEKLNKESQITLMKRISSQAQYAQNLTQCHDVIKALRMQPVLLNDWSTKEQDLVTIQENNFISSKSVYEFAKLVRILIQLLVTCATGYYIVLGEMNPGALMAASVLAGKVVAPFEQIIGTWNQILSAKESYRHLSEALNQPLTEKPISLPPLQGHISVDRVSYKPHEQAKTMLLKNITFSLEPGDCLVVIGPSGSGKSTLLKLLAGIVSPNEGSVRIDNAEISQQYGNIGDYIGFIGQQEDFFPASVKMNIGRMRSDATDQDIIKAAQLAGVHDVILGLPDGYETVIGYGGHNLSSGQKQKVALARALFKTPRILLLDEPNSHLDAAGEAHLTRVLEALRNHKITSVIISHRSSILRVANKCAVIRNGELAAFGATQEVLKSQFPTQNSNQVTETASINTTDSISTIPSKS